MVSPWIRTVTSTAGFLDPSDVRACSELQSLSCLLHIGVMQKYYTIALWKYDKVSKFFH